MYICNMKNLINNNIIVIDLRQFKNKQKDAAVVEISSFLKSINIPTNIANLALDLFYAKEGIQVWGKPFQYRNPWFKVWLSKSTLEIIAFENREGNNFSDKFLELIATISPISSESEPVWSSNDTYIPYGYESVSCQTIDEVLDKINEEGIDSLTDDELKLLNGG